MLITRRTRGILFGRRINLDQPVKKALKYIEVMLQVASSDPLATGHASCWIRCQVLCAAKSYPSYPFLWPIGCGSLFGSEGFAHPVPHSTKMVLRCLNDSFGSLLSRYQGHTSQVSWIAVGLRALRPCRNKPEQTGWHKIFLFPKWGSDTSYVTWLKLSLFHSEASCWKVSREPKTWFEAKC